MSDVGQAMMARFLYESERKRVERNFAKDHSFEEWLSHTSKSACSPLTSSYPEVFNESVEAIRGEGG